MQLPDYKPAIPLLVYARLKYENIVIAHYSKISEKDTLGYFPEHRVILAYTAKVRTQHHGGNIYSLSSNSNTYTSIYTENKTCSNSQQHNQHKQETTTPTYNLTNWKDCSGMPHLIPVTCYVFVFGFENHAITIL